LLPADPRIFDEFYIPSFKDCDIIKIPLHMKLQSFLEDLS